MEDKNLISIGLDAIDIINFISKKGRRYVATTLQELEEILPKDSEEYEKVRKLFLNSFNDYKRSVCRAIFGTDLEYTNDYPPRRSDTS
jgi:hypothetical protein